MKNLSKFLILLLAISMCLSVTALASTDVVEPTEAFYVADYANVLSDETEDYIISRNERLYASCGGQFCVVTIDFLNDLDAEQYSYALFNQWEIGGSQHNNGTLLLMVVAEDKYWMSCGAGIEDTFTAGKMNTILTNSFEADFLSGNYDDAAINTTDAVMDWYDSHYGLSTITDTVNSFNNSGGTHEIYGDDNVSYRGGFISFRTIFKIILVAGIIIFVLSRSGQTRRTSSGRSSNFPFWLFMSSMNNAARRNRTYRTTHRPHNSGFGASGFRSSGSSFRSSGGGFRSGGSSFRGGGGGFGRGGGAGRK